LIASHSHPLDMRDIHFSGRKKKKKKRRRSNIAFTVKRETIIFFLKSTIYD
jgi:hypothetical protein